MEQVHPLREWRKSNGKTLTDLADIVKVRASHLSEIENGNNEPSLDLAVKLSQVTGIDIAKFSGWRSAKESAV